MRRIVPCLDIHDGRVVKGVNFVALRDAGDPVEQARAYFELGADELVFLDISATVEGRAALLGVVEAVASQVFVPLTVGGGMRSVADARAALLRGADKIAVNSAAVARPELLTELSRAFGAQAVVLAVDARRRAGGWEVVTHGGRRATGLDAVAWCVEGVARGAGEILLTSMDCDGTQDGFDLPLLETVCEAVNVPVIASGGAGTPEHFAEALATGASAALAASVFHDGLLAIRDVKTVCAAAGHAMRTGGM